MRNRSIRVCVRFTQEESDLLKALAKHYDVTFTDLLARLLAQEVDQIKKEGGTND